MIDTYIWLIIIFGFFYFIFYQQILKKNTGIKIDIMSSYFALFSGIWTSFFLIKKASSTDILLIDIFYSILLLIMCYGIFILGQQTYYKFRFFSKYINFEKKIKQCNVDIINKQLFLTNIIDPLNYKKEATELEKLIDLLNVLNEEREELDSFRRNKIITLKKLIRKEML